MGGGIGSILYASRAVPGPDPAENEFFHYNAVGHTVANTDASGAVTKTTAYDAFGNVVAETGSSDNNRLANIKERDASIALDNHGFRYYDPQIARYLTRDPIGYIARVWRSQDGNVVIRETCGNLFTDSVMGIAWALKYGSETVETGVSVYDRLSVGQQAWLLDKVARAALSKDVPPVLFTAATEGCFVGIFVSFCEAIDNELHDPEAGHRRRDGRLRLRHRPGRRRPPHPVGPACSEHNLLHLLLAHLLPAPVVELRCLGLGVSADASW